MDDNVILRIAHIEGRDVIKGFLPDNPDHAFNKTAGWNSDHHDNPIYSAVYCMRVWTVFTQETLYDKFEQYEVTIKKWILKGKKKEDGI